jgi:hypothetical protein
MGLVGDLHYEPLSHEHFALIDAFALAETVNGLFKAEVIPDAAMAYAGGCRVRTLESVDWFNNRCLLGLVCNIPLAEAANRLCRRPMLGDRCSRVSQTKQPPERTVRLRETLTPRLSRSLATLA